MNENELRKLQSRLEGDLNWDRLNRSLYATDASVYRKIPLAVARPKGTADIRSILAFCQKHRLGLIPRAAGTSLAGQCVGEGIVLDVSRYMTRILGFDARSGRVRVEPGVVRDDLNRYLAPHGCFFGPNTSTANRSMLGGMVGNNSSGTTSIKYGVTRDKLHSLRMILADGQEVEFGPLEPAQWSEKIKSETAEGSIYRRLWELLSPEEVLREIHKEFPKPGIHRRNTGYALDELIRMPPFDPASQVPFNMAKLIAGSEGTLGVVTEINLCTDPLPPPESALVATHYYSIDDCLQDVVPLMKAELYTCEMMDKVILNCTRDNMQQRENRTFVQGDPKAILLLEVRAEEPKELERNIAGLLRRIESSERSYAQPVLRGVEVQRAFELRKAGLGLLANIPGDAKAVACIEDTAVLLEDLAPFISEFGRIMKYFGQDAVYYAHAGAGEIHLRPILNLKKRVDVEKFRTITTRVARLTKKYGGSFSGEHGDGIVRAEFIPLIIGEQNYQLIKEVKRVFDPEGILNPGKIVDPWPMDRSLRYEPDRFEWVLDTFMDFRDSGGYLRATEKCNGSGDCRKTNQAPGGMCPSYRATLDEKDSTRGRANALREFITRTPETENPFDHGELKEVLDLCISCKACARECPSNVDMAALKSEFEFQYQRVHGFGLRSRIFAYSTRLNALSSYLHPIVNLLYRSPLGSSAIKRILGIAQERSLPEVHRIPHRSLLRRLQKAYGSSSKRPRGRQRVALYIDEFSRYMDPELSSDAMELLIRLGFEVELFFGESGRTFLSKGFLRQARHCALRNLDRLSELRRRSIPLLGLEPSAVLTFTDEYRRLAPLNWSEELVAEVFLIEDYLMGKFREGYFDCSLFTLEALEVKLHAHCHQKALGNPKSTYDLLNLPEQYRVTLLPTGCCGMAGSFGYETEHYALSMKIGELGLLPSVRKMKPEQIIASNGTSCRHQIKDGTGRTALHPVSVLRAALI